MYSDFELQGIEEEKLNNKAYQTVMQRIQMEEAAASVSNGLYRENEDMEYDITIPTELHQLTKSNKLFFSEQQGSNEANNIAKPKTTSPTNYQRANVDNANYVSRLQNATSNVMGRISGLGRGVGNISGIGGIANKFLNNL